LGLLDGCLFRRVIVRMIIYLAVAVLYCPSAHGQLLLTLNLIETHQKVSLIKVYFNLIKAHKSLNSF
jgi:hypothetical protein